jgi:hypothetical protein
MAQGLRDQLVAASAESSRTMSQEIEARLRLSFDAPMRAIDEFGGPRNYWLLRCLVLYTLTIENQTGHRWWDDAFTFDAVTSLFRHAWAIRRPKGQRSRAARVIGKEMALALDGTMELAARGKIDPGALLFNAAAPVAVTQKQSPLRIALEWESRRSREDFAREMEALRRKAREQESEA